ncbi:MAG: carboxypeptidase regulatory-like domain-containing protein, partial [Thaumarchaeota archaeon]|nr:carboxypeptidase regulatory-like domain-containing protein [Nitrososphaerota archaeon]
AQEVYDSERDQVEWKVMLPRALPNGNLNPISFYSPTGALVKEHADVRAAVFDATIRLTYQGKSADVIKDALTTKFAGGFLSLLPEKALTFPKKTVITVKRLPRGTYKLEVAYKPKTTEVTFPAYTIDLSNVNVGRYTTDVSLPLTDISFKAVDLQGRTLPGVSVEVTPDLYFGEPKPVGGVITLTAVYAPQIYDVKLSWASPAYGTTATASVSDTPDGLNGKAITLPVGIVTVSVVDREGKPMGGVPVKLGNVEKETDAAGKATFEQVPLESDGKPIKYTFVFTIKGKEFSQDYELSTARTTVSFTGELFTLKVRVVGSAGQPLPYAKVKVTRGGAEIGTFTADKSGVVEVPDLLLDNYDVDVSWKGYTGHGTVTKDDLAKNRMVEISLPPYVEVAGIPLEFGTFVALIIGIILLVIVVVIILSEYIRWRGRRLGIYPPAPPKK